MHQNTMIENIDDEKNESLRECSKILMNLLKPIKFLFSLYFFAPLDLIHEERAFFTWPIFTIFCAFILPLFDADIATDGASYTYAVGVLTPLIFDSLIDNVISKKSKSIERFATLKFYYLVIAFIIVLISSVAYVKGAKEGHGLLQMLIFFAASLLAYLFYLCLHMNDFPAMVEKYDDKPYQIMEDEQVNELKEATRSTDFAEEDGVKL